MNPETLTNILAETEKHLEQCFIELALANTQTASTYMEIAGRHRKNREMLEQLRSHAAPTSPAISLLAKLSDNLQGILSLTAESELQTTTGSSENTTEILPALTAEITRICSLPATNPVRPATALVTHAASGRKTGYTKTKSTNLSVSFADGTIIQNSTARDTFVEALKKMGMEKVRRLGIITCKEPLVSPSKSENRRYAAQQPFCDGYYIFTYTSTEKKRDYLEKIAKRLGETITVEIIKD